MRDADQTTSPHRVGAALETRNHVRLVLRDWAVPGRGNPCDLDLAFRPAGPRFAIHPAFGPGRRRLLRWRGDRYDNGLPALPPRRAPIRPDRFNNLFR